MARLGFRPTLSSVAVLAVLAAAALAPAADAQPLQSAWRFLFGKQSKLLAVPFE